ncbi:MAG: metallophosphoesterase [Atopobiaceae bacterium]|nr:metallophosphoesterase [Atopobiaceae bacterium]
MRPDTDVIVHELAPRTIKVWVCGDVHVGAENCQLKEFERWIAEIENDPDAYVIFTGDLMDTATKSSVGDVFHGMNPREQMEYIHDTLYNLAHEGKILAMLTGNHELRVARETSIDPLYDVAVRLGIQNVYRRDFAAVRIRMSSTEVRDNSKGTRIAYSILAFHGGSDFKVRQMANNVEGFDALVTGHSHQPVTRIPAHLCLTNANKIMLREVVQVTGCSWCDYAGYGARGMFQPQVQSRPQALVLHWVGSNNADKRLTVEW